MRNPGLSRTTFLSLFIVAVTACAAGSAHASIIYVDDSAPPGGDGQSWTTAYRYLQDALFNADSGTVVRVAQGRYQPDQSEHASITPGDRTVPFAIVDGVEIYGGFAGIGHATPDDRQPAAYVTRLSGDLLGDDGPDFANMLDNSEHVVVSNDSGPSTIFDGFVVSGGSTLDKTGHHGEGGGFRFIRCALTVRSCIFENCRAANGACGDVDRGRPVFVGCIFRDSSARYRGGALQIFESNCTLEQCIFTGLAVFDPTYNEGGAIYASQCKNLLISECQFSMNYAHTGSAVYLWRTFGTIARCVFEQNEAYNSSAFSAGGAVLCTDSSPLLEECSFSGNFGGNGSALRIISGSNPIITDCEFVDNRDLAIYIQWCAPRFLRCSFHDHPTHYVLGIFGWGGVTRPVFDECVFESNSRTVIKNEHADPTFLRCTFASNSNGADGTVHNQGGEAVLSQCTFTDNSTTYHLGAPVIRETTGARSRYFQCVFESNTSPSFGGAIQVIQSEPMIIACQFRHNSSGLRGGAIHNDRGHVTCISSLFAECSSPRGGAIYNEESSHATVRNCVFVRISSPGQGSALHLNSALGSTTVTNCIVRANTEPAFRVDAGTLTINQSALQAPWAGPGAGNIYDNPLLVNDNPANGPIDVSLLPGSPCIDAGLTTEEMACWLDLHGRHRVVDDSGTADTGDGIPHVVDIGAVEYASSAGIDCDLSSVIDSCELAAGTTPDCNANGVPDLCDVLSAGDCNANFIPDECELDCDGNGQPDSCDIQQRISVDCNGNSVPDTCDLAAGAPDCNLNGIPDSCDIQSGFAEDCNSNDIPDSCDLLSGLPDCNANGILDSCDLLVPGNDCNHNGIPDECDLANGTSADVNKNGIPDECGPDCNSNGLEDRIDLMLGTSADCNGNGLPDDCDLANNTMNLADCNNNGLIDSCEIAEQTAPDCDGNGRPDSCDSAEDPFVSYSITENPEFYFSYTDGIIWLNQFTIEDGGEVISAIGLTWGPVGVGAPATVCLWKDPNNDGHPADAVLLATAEIRVSVSPQAPHFHPLVIPVPPTYVGEEGQRFFVGASAIHSPTARPSTLDMDTFVPGRSWFARGSDIHNLSANPTPPTLIDTLGRVNFVVHARSGSINDIDMNSVPDVCEACMADIAPPGGDGHVGVRDLLGVIGAWGPCPQPCVPPSSRRTCPADLTDNCAVAIEDLLAVIATWGACP